jgi:DNA-binding MarR family transcriptional regulator
MSKPAPVTSAAVPFQVTVHVRDHCLCLAAQRAARTLARRFDEALRPAGLTSGQFSLLMSLNQPRPPSIGAVAAVLAMDRTTLTANLKPLVRRGLVSTTVDPDDRRGRLVSLTKPGRTVLREAVPIWRRVHKKIDRMLALAADGKVLRTALRALS